MQQMGDTKYEPADIEIYLKNQGLVCKEKSLIAYQESDGKILAVGTEAEQITNLHQNNVIVKSPLRQGMIADYRAAIQMFRMLLERACGKRHLWKPNIAVGVSLAEITDVEKKAIEDMIYQIGSREVTLFEGDYQTFEREMREYYPKEFEKYQIFIIITKYEPERYIIEALSNVVRYTRQKGISIERMQELFREAQEE
ncbi:MAG: rod shape-determining protein [Lachnospiraceae bacterium]